MKMITNVTERGIILRRATDGVIWEPGPHRARAAVEAGNPGVVVAARISHSVYSRAPQVLRARIALCSRPSSLSCPSYRYAIPLFNRYMAFFSDVIICDDVRSL